jgi:hypothetical protein
MRYCLLFFITIVCPVLALSPTPVDLSLLCVPPQDTQLGRLYVSMLDRDIEHSLQQFLNKHDDAPGLLAEELAGAMAFAYTQPGSTFYQNAATLSSVRSLFTNLKKTLGQPSLSSGDLVKKLEPLTSALACLDAALPRDEKTQYQEIITTGLTKLLPLAPPDTVQERIASYAVLAMGYHLTRQEKFLIAAREGMNKERPHLSFKSGQVPEIASVQDMIQSLFLYRIMSGDASLDSIVIQLLQEYTHTFTRTGLPMVILADTATPLESLIAGVLGPLTYYRSQEPDFETLASLYLEHLMTKPPGFTLHRGGRYFLQGAHNHKQIRKQKSKANTAKVCFSQHEHYVYVQHKNYQTAVSLRSLHPYKGMQVWQYGTEPPLLFPFYQTPSKAFGLGFDSSQIDCQMQNDHLSYTFTELSDTISCLVVKQSDLYTGYVFAPDATVVLYRQSTPEGFSVKWIANNPICAEIDIASKVEISFKDSNARMLLPHIDPSLTVFHESTEILIEIPGSWAWFVLGGPQTISIVRPVLDDTYFVHVKESEQTYNLVLNLSDSPFRQEAMFPGTKIPVPALAPYEAAMINTQ